MNTNNEKNHEEGFDWEDFFNLANIFSFLRVLFALFAILVIQWQSWHGWSLYNLILFVLLTAVIAVPAFKSEDQKWDALMMTVISILVPLAVYQITLAYEGGPNYIAVGVSMAMMAAWFDFFDGRLARKYYPDSRYGARIDAGSDKSFQILMLTYGLYYLATNRPDLLSWLIPVAVVEVLLLGWASFYRLKMKKWLEVNRVGKIAIFGRMTGLTWLLLSTAGPDWFYVTFSAGVAYISIIVGCALGLVALKQYIEQGRVLLAKA